MNSESDLIKRLKAFADLSRLRILSLLLFGEDLCSCEIEKMLGLNQSNASRHLQRLRETGLVEYYKRAQWAHYCLPRRVLDGGPYRSLIEEARNEAEIYKKDIENLKDYRGRGFSCATIHEWKPFELSKEIGGKNE